MVHEHFGSVPVALLQSVPSLVAIGLSLSVRALSTRKACLHPLINGQYGQASGTNGGSVSVHGTSILKPFEQLIPVFDIMVFDRACTERASLRGS